LNQRSYLVTFNDNAPSFGHNLGKLQGWLQETFGVVPDDVQHVYEIVDFKGYAFWATTSMMERVLAHETTLLVEEDQMMYATAPFTSRPDWGQTRALEKGSIDLSTVPANLYPGSYPSGNNATDGTGGWDWTQAVKNKSAQRSNGNRSKIFIVDTGVSNHQEFGSRITTRQDYVTPSRNASDGNGHGTHCAGSAAGQYRGLAPAAEIGAVRVLGDTGSGTNANVVAGIDFVATTVTANANRGLSTILSASLGGGSSTTTNNAIRNANTAGVINVVAAGNDNNANACNVSPAGAPEAITVGATTNADARASFSNSGSCLDVFAPGVNIHSSWYTSTTAYNTISGTSMATPLVSGAVGQYVTLLGSVVRGSTSVKQAITTYGTRNVVTGTLLAGTPNIMINAQWN
jgi:subtilisin family serine protease